MSKIFLDILRKIEKILEQLEKERIKPGEFERITGISNGYLSNTEGRGADISQKILDKIRVASPDAWNVVERALGPDSIILGGHNIAVSHSTDQISGIPFWDMDVVGQAASFENVISSTKPTYYLDAPDFNGCYAFRANTDTMEGVIRTGSIIFATKIQDWVSHLEYGQIYLIICNDGRKYLRYIKRFKENPREYFFLQSENKFYDEFELPKAAIDSIWLIHGHLSKRI